MDVPNKIEFRYRTKPELERFVFECFSSTGLLKVKDFESRPEPEPDILAALQDDSKVAVELTQADDPNLIELQNTAQRMSVNLKNRRGELRNIDDLAGCSFHVSFFEKVSHGKRNRFLPNVIEAINNNGPLPSQPILDGKEVIGSIRCFKHESVSAPDFTVSNATHVGDYLCKAIRKKLEKEYKTSHPIYLLVWAQSLWLTEMWYGEVSDIARAQTKFERIFVLDYPSKIAFDSNFL